MSMPIIAVVLVVVVVVVVVVAVVDANVNRCYRPMHPG